MLTGCGIVTGLGFRFDGTSLTLSKGTALTGDGDLIRFPKDTVFRFVKAFGDESAHYTPFEGLGLLELLVATEPLGSPLSALSDGQDWAVVLYLESYRYDPDICTGADCDNRGQLQRNIPRVLLVPKKVLKGVPVPYRNQLRAPSVDRVLLNKQVNTYEELTALFRGAASRGLNDLEGALEKTYSVCQPLLAPVYSADPTSDWSKKLTAVVDRVESDPFGIEYVYAFAGDLADALREFVEALEHDDVGLAPIRSPFQNT